MKKALYILLFIVFLVAAYFVTGALYPKYTSYFPVFAIILLLDVYLWFSLKNRIQALRPSMAFILTFLYWLPFFAMVMISVASVIVSFVEWNMIFYTYLSGSIFIIYAAKVLAVLFLFVADLVRVAQHSYRFVRQKKNKQAQSTEIKKITRARFIQNIGILGGGFVLSGLIIGMIKWAYNFKIKTLGITIPKLPSSFNGFKIVQISDIHLGSWTQPAALQEAVSMINNLEADIIVFTGDLVNFTTREAYPFEYTLSKLKARYGVYAVLGNHDFGDYVNWDTEEEKQQNLDDLLAFYKRIGWKLIRNDHVLINKLDDKIALIGVDNWSAISRFPKYGDINQATAHIDGVPVKILLSHDPTHWDAEVVKSHKDIDLTLSGHTHGFQFGIEWKNLRWSPAQYMYKQWAGFYARETGGYEQYLYVNRGLGNIGYPGRIGIMPEITLFTLYNI